MAKHTKLSLRSYTFYQVFPRQHSKTQDFNGLINDLDRIQALGVDVLYLLPIHPIGQKARKGSKGSPYAIFDYYQVNDEYGTLKDFDLLVKEAHKRHLKVMIDIVINHTSRDSILTVEHPDWFYHDEKGNFANRVGDWSDITDLDYNNKDVWAYMIDMLKYWAKRVDGFRCDVAPLLPIDFWIKARRQINQLKPDFIWLSESVHPSFIKYLRDLGFDCSTDSEMYQAFDICYDYDIFDYMDRYLKDPNQLQLWLQEIYRQESVYPNNYVKLRSFENHDQERLYKKVRDDNHFKQMVALSFFLKGAAFIYAGEEHQACKRPDLFEDDLVAWNKKQSIEPLIKQLTTIKKDRLFQTANFHWHEHDKAAIFSYENKTQAMIGLFNLEHAKTIEVPLKDGAYTNMLHSLPIIVKDQQVTNIDEPVIIKTDKGNYL